MLTARWLIRFSSWLGVKNVPWIKPLTTPHCRAR